MTDLVERLRNFRQPDLNSWNAAVFRWRELAIEAADALERAAESVDVKRLEWSQIDDEDWWVAETDIGLNYEVRRARASVRVRFPAERKFVAFDGDVEAAKAAAQAHHDAIIRSALASTESIICDVLTIKHSSGFPDHFTRVRKGDRELTFFMSKIKGRCEYHAAELNWLLNGAKKPDILDFDDTIPDGYTAYQSSIAR